jgi:DNA-directed RNA polymerase subunit RPC12/RpoP
MQIDYSCPQCGAPIILDEADRLLACPFCRVRLLMEPGDLFRYLLPPAPANTSRPEMIYAPYGRFRGMVFDLRSPQGSERVLDLNYLAVSPGIFPATLGLRPQAMQLRPAIFEAEDRRLSPTAGHPCLPPNPPASAPAAGSGSRLPAHHRQAAVGEVRSLIYAPFYYRKGRWLDAVTDRPLESSRPPDQVTEFVWDREKDWAPAFIPAFCPECGWDLAAEKESCVLFCPQCRSAWEPRGDRLQPLPCSTLDLSATADARYFLPFWRFRLPFEPPDHFQLPADRLLTLEAGQPPPWSATKTRTHYWIPAFKIAPRVFLRLASRITQSQDRGSKAENGLPEAYHPVTLPALEALTGVEVVQADIEGEQIVLSSSRPAIAPQDWEKDLVLLPFHDTPYELVHPPTGLGISKNILNLGKYI